MPNDKLDQQLARAHAAYERASEKALAAFVAAFPVGRVVKWQHGKHWRMGEIVSVSNWSYRHAGASVRSITSGKLLRVSRFDLMRGLGLGV